MFDNSWPFAGLRDAITMVTRTLALSLDVPIQNAPNRMAPTKANAIQTASTFSFTARSTRSSWLFR